MAASIVKPARCPAPIRVTLLSRADRRLLLLEARPLHDTLVVHNAFSTPGHITFQAISSPSEGVRASPSTASSGPERAVASFRPPSPSRRSRSRGAASEPPEKVALLCQLDARSVRGNSTRGAPCVNQSIPMAVTRRATTASSAGASSPRLWSPRSSELERAYEEIVLSTGFQHEWRALLKRLRRSPDAPLPRRSPGASHRSRGAHARGPVAQARGPLPHRRAQDQQRARAGAARQEAGQGRASSPRPAPGQHGVATATAAAHLRACPARSTMGAVDVARQAPNVGAHGAARRAGDRRSSRARAPSKDAINEALRDWVTNVRHHVLLRRLRGRPSPLPCRS